MAVPVLVVVTGPAGSGKTTLAHELAQAMRCPIVSRDEIKEGMAFHEPTSSPRLGMSSRRGPCRSSSKRFASDLGVPTMDVATTNGYTPTIDEVASWLATDSQES